MQSQSQVPGQPWQQHDDSSSEGDENSSERSWSSADFQSDDESEWNSALSDGSDASQSTTASKRKRPNQRQRRGIKQRLLDRYRGKNVAPDVNRQAQGKLKRTTQTHRKSVWLEASKALWCNGRWMPTNRGWDDFESEVWNMVHRAFSNAWDSNETKELRTRIQRSREVLSAWFADKAEKGVGRRSTREAAAWVNVSSAEVLLQLYTEKPKRSHLTWTRYLDPALQRKIIGKGSASSKALNEALRAVRKRITSCREGHTIVYIVVPRHGEHWYVGQTKERRKHNGVFVSGAPERALEHLLATMSGRWRRRAARGVKRYQRWGQQGDCAVRLLPVASLPEEQANHLESYVIAHDQPPGNVSGRRVIQKEEWRRYEEQHRHGIRPHRQHRPDLTPTEALRMNFWDRGTEKDAILRGEWREEYEVANKIRRGELTKAKVGIKGWKVEWEAAVAKSPYYGPIDIYNSENERLLLAVLAGTKMKNLQIQTERINTAQWMKLYDRCEELYFDHHRRSGRGKIGRVLRAKGIGSVAAQHVTVELGPGQHMSQMSRAVKHATNESVRDSRARAFWNKRFVLHRGAQRCYATGRKNMRRVAQEFDATVQMGRTAEQDWEDRRAAPIIICQRNWHVGRPDDVLARVERNANALWEAAKKAGCPLETRQAILTVAGHSTLQKAWNRKPGTEAQRQYVEDLDEIATATACTLDRNTRGAAILSKECYHAAMWDLYGKDPHSYRIILDTVGEEAEFRRVQRAGRRHRPSSIPACNPRVLGFEYLNLKEKCTSPIQIGGSTGSTATAATESQSAEGEMPRGLSRNRITCGKPHSHWREVSTQSAAMPINHLRSIGRGIGHMLAMDSSPHLKSAGLHCMGDEISEMISKLKCTVKDPYVCKRCGGPKSPLTILRGDLSQMYKRCDGVEAERAFAKLARRIEKRWGTTAVGDQRRTDGKKKAILMRKAVKGRGIRSWSHKGSDGDIQRTLRWTSSLNLSRVGKHLLKRIHGMAMGATLSGIKADLAICERERRWLSDTGKQRRHNFCEGHESWETCIAGCRYADDILFASEDDCDCCMEEWGRLIYTSPHLFEAEERGRQATFCDREVTAVEKDDGSWTLRQKHHDKNEFFLRGEQAEWTRCRYEPALGRRMKRSLRQWISCGLHQVHSKNRGVTDAETMVLQKCETIRIVGEMIILGHRVADIESAMRSLRQGKLQEYITEGIRWLQRFRSHEEPIDESEVQQCIWDYHIALGQW